MTFLRTFGYYSIFFIVAILDERDHVAMSICYAFLFIVKIRMRCDNI